MRRRRPGAGRSRRPRSTPRRSRPRPHGGKKVLTVAVAQSVDSLSPFLAQRLVSTSIHRLMYEYLTNYDPKDAHTDPGPRHRVEAVRRTS